MLALSFSMKHGLNRVGLITLAMGGSFLLSGCVVTRDTYSSVKENINDGYPAAKDTLSQTKSHLGNLADAAREDTYASIDHIAGWMRPKKVKPNLPVEASYCYSAYQDILCYRSPMPGWEYRLVSYQGTDAAPPPAAMMQPMPKQQADAGMAPEKRVASTKPVFEKIPPPPESKIVDPEKMIDRPRRWTRRRNNCLTRRIPHSFNVTYRMRRRKGNALPRGRCHDRRMRSSS